MGNPERGSDDVRLDRAGLVAWLDRLSHLERRIKRQVARTSRTGESAKLLSGGGISALSGAAQLRDRHVIALSNARGQVLKVSTLLAKLYGVTDKAAGGVIAADRRGAGGIPGSGD
ncbi:MAG: hypothetical protein GEU94_05385 [Micromonosporaceae bacterium]|nr:hypothetical protein [Micromonosporaceae bacterium]